MPASYMFVTGIERSGTKLFFNMLRNHPQIQLYGASLLANLSSTWNCGLRDEDEVDQFLTDLFSRTRFHNSGVKQSSLRAMLATRLPLRLVDALLAVMDPLHENDSSTGQILYRGEYSPTYVDFLLKNRRRLDRLIGDYKVLHVIRDGRAVMSSVLKAREIRHGRFSKDIVELANRWAKATRLHEEFPARCYFQVSYEDLVCKPRETLESVCEFLGIAYSPKMLEFEHYVGQSSIHQLLAGPLDTRRLCAWQTETLPRLLQIFQLVAGPALHQQGYGPLPRSLQSPRSVVLYNFAVYKMLLRLQGVSQKLLRRPLTNATIIHMIQKYGITSDYRDTDA